MANKGFGRQGQGKGNRHQAQNVRFGKGLGQEKGPERFQPLPWKKKDEKK